MQDRSSVDTESDGAAAGRRAAEPLAAIPDYSTLPAARVPTPMGAVGVVAVKIVGLYCLVQALPFIYLIPADLIMMFSGRGVGYVDILINLLDPALYLAAGVLLVNRATWVATRVLGFEEPADDPRPRAPGRRLQAIAFSVLGVYLAIGAVAELIRLFVQARYQAVANNNDVISTLFDDPSSVMGTAAQLALGVWLFIGSKRLARLWSGLQNRGHSPASNPVE